MTKVRKTVLKNEVIVSSMAYSQEVPSLLPSPSSSNFLGSKSASLLKTDSIKSDKFSSGRNENVINVLNKS